jgi:hypothetical protein
VNTCKGSFHLKPLFFRSLKALSFSFLFIWIVWWMKRKLPKVVAILLSQFLHCGSRFCFWLVPFRYFSRIIIRFENMIEWIVSSISPLSIHTLHNSMCFCFVFFFVRHLFNQYSMKTSSK